jgi:hypothetical protein
MSADRISHIVALGIEKTATQCANIKSRKEPKKQCSNTATHGEFCGLHFKHPRPWCPGSPASIAARVKGRRRPVFGLQEKVAVRTVQKWWRFFHGLRATRRHGPAYWVRSLCTNDSDFFSTDPVGDISGATFYSYKDVDNHIYGFDVRSIHTLLYRARTGGEIATNPFTRTAFPPFVNRQVQTLVRALCRCKLPTEWTPLAPPTPVQQIRMKIVDAFSKIDELNYYSSPDWFLELDAEGHRGFYIHLHDIWNIRANLSLAQKNTIVPGFASRLFRTPRWALADQGLEALQRINLGIIRLLIGSAVDRNDRILGAMYVVSALTLVCEGARTAYPWLYESVVEDAPVLPLVPRRHAPLANLLGVGWLNDLLALRAEFEGGRPDRAPAVPALALPPPADAENS